MRQYLTTICIFFSCLTYGQSDTTKMFIMGNSLIQHEPGGSPNDSTTVAHWVYRLGKQEQNNIAASGQYGFLRQHDNLVPIPQWGYDSVPPVWDYDSNPNFDEQGFNTLLLTAGNFIQNNPPGHPFEEDDPTTPLSSTRTIINWLNIEVPGIDFIIYENWPDMAGYIANQGFPPTLQEFSNYNTYTLGAFHDWWLEYQDSLRLTHPANEVRMIPVGPILAHLFQDTLLTSIPVLELYEDNAPHGRANLYFLAGLISYMAIFEEKAPMNFNVPAELHPSIASSYAQVVDYIWNYLLAFDDLSGNSRVFRPNATLGDSDQDGIDDNVDNCPDVPNPGQEDLNNNNIGDACETLVDIGVEILDGTLYIDNDNGILLKGKDGNCYLIFVNNNGALVHELSPCPE